MKTTVSTIPLDDFTDKLLKVFRELIKKEAIRYKKTFSETILIPNLSQFNQIERCTRNYPEDSARRAQVRANLLEKYGVNPEYLTGRSTKVFLREPDKVPKAMKLDAVEYNFKDGKQVGKLQESMEQLQADKDKLIEENNILRERLSRYEKPDIIPDNNSDKSNEKKI